MRDCFRLAKTEGAPFVGPPAHPFNPLLALRACATAGAPNSLERYAVSMGLSHAVWGAGLDVTNEQVCG